MRGARAEGGGVTTPGGMELPGIFVLFCAERGGIILGIHTCIVCLLDSTENNSDGVTDTAAGGTRRSTAVSCSRLLDRLDT